MKCTKQKRKKGELNLPLIYGLIAGGAFFFGFFLFLINKIPLIPCIFKEATGYPCPTCGSTRMVLSFFEFNLFAAFQFNPLLFLACFLFGFWVIYGFYMWVTGYKLVFDISEREGNWIRIAIIAIVAINWLYLILSGI